MKLNYVKSSSSVKPDLIDTTSSKTTVYIRKNIIEKERIDNEIEDKYIKEYILKDSNKLDEIIAEYKKIRILYCVFGGANWIFQILSLCWAP